MAGVQIPIHDEMLPGDLAEPPLGRFTFTVGIHRTLDGVMEDRTVGTVSRVLRP